MEHSAWLAGISRQRPSKNPVCRLSENFLNTVCDTIGRFVLVLVLAAARVNSSLTGQQRAKLLGINKVDGKEQLRYVSLVHLRAGSYQNSSGNPAFKLQA